VVWRAASPANAAWRTCGAGCSAAVAQGLEEAQRDLAAPPPTVPAIVPAETQAAGWSFGPHVPRRPSPPARMRRGLILHRRILRIRGVVSGARRIR